MNLQGERRAFVDISLIDVDLWEEVLRTVGLKKCLVDEGFELLVSSSKSVPAFDWDSGNQSASLKSNR